MTIHKELNNNKLEKISGGTSEKECMSRDDFDLQHQGAEEALDGNMIWGINLNETIPFPSSKTDNLVWNDKNWTPTYAHCGWHQAKVIWKDGEGNFLIPTAMEIEPGMGIC